MPTEAGYQTLQALSNSNADLITAALGNLRSPSSQGKILIGQRSACPASAIDATTGQCQVDWGFFRRNDIGVNSSHEWTARDYSLTNDSFFVRYTDNYNASSPDLFANPNSLPYSDTEQHGPARILGVMWSHTFSPTVLNELRFSAQQLEFGFYPTAATLANPMAHLPTITLTNTLDFFWGGFEQATFPRGRGHKTFQFQHAVSFTKGMHTLKIGADLAVLLVKHQFPFNADGTMNVGPSEKDACGTEESPYTCTALENYLDGYLGFTGTLGRNWGNPRQAVPTTQQAFYFQDSWKFRPNLTLDYSLRYEYQPPDPSNVLTYPATDRKNIATAMFPLTMPSTAIATTSGRALALLILRGSGKAFLEKTKPFCAVVTGCSTTSSLPTSATTPRAVPQLGRHQRDGTIVRRAGLTEPSWKVSRASPLPSPLTSVTSVDNHLANPLTHQWNLNVQREMPARIKAEVAHLGTRGQRLWVNEQLNPRVEGRSANLFQSQLTGDSRQSRRLHLPWPADLGDSPGR
jgi:hypothetical protein